MTPEEWYEKRARIAAQFGVEPDDVSPEAVWLLSEDALSGADRTAAPVIYRLVEA